MINYLNIFKKIRQIITFWVAPYDIAFVKSIRENEVALANKILNPYGKGNICEIGGGAGWQKEYLTKLGWSVRSFDLKSTNYIEYQLKGIEVYDGMTLPINDSSIDIIFSSNTLEHVKQLSQVFEDHQRILKEGGYCLHILPSSSWRVWTILTDIIKKFYWSKPHGEFSKNVFEEILHFSKGSWISRFENGGFEVVHVTRGRLFYTGNTLLSSRLSLSNRRKLSFILGSSCNYYLLRKCR
jgi:SAM-dependent methyltransferase